METYDLMILGGGPGGYVAAIKAAQKGLKVALVEKEVVGGACLNWGCIPTKTWLKSAKLYDQMLHAGDYGIKVDPKHVSVDFKAFLDRKNKVVKKLTGGVKFLLKKNKVTLFEGFGNVISPTSLKVGDQTVTFKNLIIATGASPFLPPIPGLEEAFKAGHAVSARELLDIDTMPKSLVIVGGGVIGVEFATIFNALGADVSIYERESDILLTVDEELRAAFKKKIEADGIKVYTSANVTGFKGADITVEKGGKTETIKADKALVSVGMRPNLKGTEALNLTLDKGAIKTDDLLKTTVKNVFAIGDVNGKMQLAHVASAEGLVVVDHLLGHDRPMNYDQIPSGIYTFPEIAQVGATEQALKKAGVKYKVSTFPLSANGKALAEAETIGMVKMLADEKYGQILGVHIMAQNATEMISEGVLMKTLEACAEDIAHAVHPHPTLSEMMHEVAHGLIDLPISI
jgi:dihydrolipoamide dehydrogenase